MSRRQDRPPKEKKPKADKQQPKLNVKKTPEQMRKEIREAFRNAFQHEDE